MQARLTAYVPDKPALIRVLEDGASSIGRERGSDLHFDDPSVSRLHARLCGEGGQWRLLDLGSKNGSFVDGVRVGEAERVLPPSCGLRFGDVLCEFAALEPAQAAAMREDWSSRRAAATAHTQRLEGIADIHGLLDASLRGVLELAQCERGFVLAGDAGRLQVRASLGLDSAGFGGQAFRGSVGAVQRALQSRHSVVCNDIGRDAWLANRQSVVAAGLSALVCLPLRDGDATIGAVYADRVRPGPPISALDLELLEAFAERAALWMVARDASETLRQLDEAAPDWSAIAAAWDTAA